MRWRCSTKGELKSMVEEYADEIGKPTNEVLLTLLFETLRDLDMACRRNRMVRGFVNDFGGWLHRTRETAGLSQRELARIAGISPSAVNRIESRRVYARMLEVEKIVGALNRRLEAE